MKKQIVLFFYTIALLYAPIMMSCPCEFSPEDQRPFFEQYEEISPTQLPEEEL